MAASTMIGSIFSSGEQLFRVKELMAGTSAHSAKTASKIIGSIFFTGEQLFGVKELTVGPR